MEASAVQIDKFPSDGIQPPLIRASHGRPVRLTERSGDVTRCRSTSLTTAMLNHGRRRVRTVVGARL